MLFVPIFQLTDELPLWFLSCCDLYTEQFAMARVSCGMETERGPEENGAKSVIEAIHALLVTETEQRINRVQKRGICQATVGFPSKDMGPRLRELDTNFTKRLRKQRSGGRYLGSSSKMWSCSALQKFSQDRS